MTAADSSSRVGSKRSFRRVALAFLGVTSLGAFIWWGYSLKWTGFGPTFNADGKWVPSKTLWDWLTLAGVPVMLALVAYIFSRKQKEIELRQTTDIQRENALQSYFSEISKLLLERNLGQSDAEDEVRVIARALTLSVLRSLDGDRKGAVMRFLIDARLVQGKLDIRDADLRNADLRHVYFHGFNLRNVDLRGAKLDWANFKNADGWEEAKLDRKWQVVAQAATRCSLETLLRGQDLRNANLKDMSLYNCDLRGTDLRGAVLDGAHFQEAIINERTILDSKWRLVYDVVNGKADVRKLHDVDFRHADLLAVNLEDSDLSGAKLDGANLSSAILNNSIMANVSASLADFSLASLAGATLKNARFILATFVETQFVKSDCSGKWFLLCDFVGADFTGAKLEGAKFSECTYDSNTKWPAAFAFPSDGLKLSEESNSMPPI